MKLLLIQSLAVVFASAGIQAETSSQLRGGSNEEGEEGKCCNIYNVLCIDNCLGLI